MCKADAPSMMVDVLLRSAMRPFSLELFGIQTSAYRRYSVYEMNPHSTGPPTYRCRDLEKSELFSKFSPPKVMS